VAEVFNDDFKLLDVLACSQYGLRRCSKVRKEIAYRCENGKFGDILDRIMKKMNAVIEVEYGWNCIVKLSTCRLGDIRVVGANPSPISVTDRANRLLKECMVSNERSTTDIVDRVGIPS
jgi:hypothetical protein